MTAGSFAAVVSPLAGIAAWLAGALPAQGADNPSTGDVVQFLVDLKAQGIITGRDLGAILKAMNSP